MSAENALRGGRRIITDPRDWPSWCRHFTAAEWKCKETGEFKADLGFLEVLDAIRHDIQAPLILSSGYRSPQHSVERVKAAPGAHTCGQAVDILCNGSKAVAVVQAITARWQRLPPGIHMGLGVMQKGPGAARFIHFDFWERRECDAMWSY